MFKDYFPPIRGGVELHINDVAHSLEGFRFTVLTSSRSRQTWTENDDGVDVIRASEWLRISSTAITPSWARLLRELQADVVHFHVPNPFGELAYLVSRCDIPMVVTYHADIVGRRLLLPFFRPFQERFLQKARRIIVSNPRTLDTSPSLRPHRDRAAIVPFGVDPIRWEKRPAEADRIRSTYGTPLVLFLGRLAYYKGLDVLIDAMTRVDATLLVAGDGPMRSAVEDQARRFSPSGRIVLTGEVGDDDRGAYYHAADVFVLPSTSRAEGFGIAMLEAMACGTPAISTELGTGTSWVNKHGETGLVVPPGDAEALASAINSLLSDGDTRRRMGAAAARRARQDFSKKAMLEALSAIYYSAG